MPSLGADQCHTGLRNSGDYAGGGATKVSQPRQAKRGGNHSSLIIIIMILLLIITIIIIIIINIYEYFINNNNLHSLFPCAKQHPQYVIIVKTDYRIQYYEALVILKIKNTIFKIIKC